MNEIANAVKRCIGFILLSLFLALTPCSVSLPGVSDSINVQAASAASVKLSDTSVTLIKGQTTKLTISGTDSTVTWKSNKKSIAKVNAKGKVTALKNGAATITAIVDGAKYKCKVTVVTPSISAKTVSLTVGKTKKLKISGTTETVTWKSSNKKVATVSKSGKITAKKAGTATITATVLGKKYKCVVTVSKAAASSDSSSSDSNTSGSSSSGSTSSSAASSGSASSSSSTSSSSSSATTSSVVYITKTGSKYHRAGCRYLSSSMIEIDLSTAVAKGYEACSVCN
ncbi:MAG: Ig-like domain-containing protein [Clostridiales bacterium]|nr:Ig-like domain-containing protein [Clostridiales bacterium]